MGEPLVSNSDRFRQALESLLAQASERNQSHIVVVSGDLHRLVGGYPGKDHRMPLCCQVMRTEMHGGDEVVSEPSSGQGATLSVKYKLPR